jgi:predicted RNA-binding Zn-ribbon protein involved in translation (DUF1610 family)
MRLYADAQVALTPESRMRPDTPAAGAPALGTPAAGTPAAGTPARGTPAVGLATAESAAAPAPDGATSGAVTPGAVTPGAPGREPSAAPGPAAVDPRTAESHTAEFPVPDGVGGGERRAVADDAVTGDHPVVAPGPARPTPARPSLGPEIPIVRAGSAEAPTMAIPIPRGPEPPTRPMPFPVRPPAQVVGGTCPHCARPLPAERGVTFCPYCGENLTVRRCPACSTELEVGWRFCITCGREVDDPAAAAPA